MLSGESNSGRQNGASVESVQGFVESMTETLEGIHELAPEVPGQLGPVEDLLWKAACLIEKAYDGMDY